MPHDRYFADALFAAEKNVTLEGPELHHLCHVMRASYGDEVELVNGKGQLARALVSEIGKRSAQLTVAEVHSEDRPSFEVILSQAIPRSNRLETILEKGCELGMTQIWLFPGERSERKNLEAQKSKRIRSVLIAAMKQCGRLYLPQLLIKPPLQQWEEIPYPAYFGDIDPQAKAFENVWKQQPPKEGVLFFVGPESGFTDKEIDRLKKSCAQGVKLHQNILRTDTAPLVALSLISQWRL